MGTPASDGYLTHLGTHPDQAAQWTEGRNPPRWRGRGHTTLARRADAVTIAARPRAPLARPAGVRRGKIAAGDRKEGVDSSYVSRMVNLTILAPDIVAAVLDEHCRRN
jgi:hypothetical protein